MTQTLELLTSDFGHILILKIENIQSPMNSFKVSPIQHGGFFGKLATSGRLSVMQQNVEMGGLQVVTYYFKK
jgi:hypothetical protein